MSRVTRCPNCETLFKVVPDQLRLSQGWVRCGSCGTVFDASEQMQHEQSHNSASSDGSGLSPQVWSLLLEDGAGHAVPLASATAASIPTPTPDSAPALASEKQEQVEYSAPSAIISAANRPYSKPSPVTTVVLTEASFQPIDDPSGTDPAASWNSNWSHVAQDLHPAEPSLLDQVIAMPPFGQAEASLAEPAPDAHASPKWLRDLGDAPEPPSPSDTHADAPPASPTWPNSLPPLHASATDDAASFIDSAHPLLKKASAKEAMEAADAETPAPAVSAPPPSGPRKKKSRKPPPLEALETGASPADQQRTEEDSLSFVKEAKRRQFWRKPWVRTLLGLSLVAVAGGLAARWAHQERDWLGAAYPDSKPALEQWCAQMQCTIQPYQKLESIAIQHSEFNRLPNGGFQLSLSIRNLDRLALATPSLILTLTNATAQTVTQQTLSPERLKAPSQLQAQRDWSGSIILMLDNTPDADQISGYRLEAFYP